MFARALCLAATLVAACIVRAAESPNILLILSDDQSWAHLGCYGNADIKTPNVDAFAKEGVRFDRYYVGTPQCVPSRMSIHTGRYPHTHRTLLNPYQIPDDEPTLARVLGAAGYRTVVKVLPPGNPPA